jgi:N utilization substance protein B
MSASISPASRRKARELALQVLYAVDHSEGARARRIRGDEAAAEAAELAPSGPPEVELLPTRRPERRRAAPSWTPTEPATPEQTFDAIAEHFEMAAGARDFARELALEAHAREAEIDALVSRHARNWRVDRMAVVDRNILRLATYELCFTETPTAVVLDEAVQLARRFGDDPSSAFVNGILDAIARGVRPSAP